MRLNSEKIGKTTLYLTKLHAKRNRLIYHMFQSVQSPMRSLGTKLTEILFHRYLDRFRTYAFLITWLLDNFFHDDFPKNFTFFKQAFRKGLRKMAAFLVFDETRKQQKKSKAHVLKIFKGLALLYTHSCVQRMVYNKWLVENPNFIVVTVTSFFLWRHHHYIKINQLTKIYHSL